MRKTALLYIFTLLTIFSSIVIAGKRDYYFSQLSTENGLSQITVTSICQDGEGFMWFGTRNGLNRFDGYSFDVYQNNSDDVESISDSHVLCIKEDALGDLWIGTNNGLNRLRKTTDKFDRYFSITKDVKSLSSNMIISLYVDHKECLWIGTSRGLDKYNADSNSFSRIELPALLGNAVNCIVGQGDFLYLATSSNGVVSYNLETDETKVLFKDERLKDIKTLFIDSNGNLWVGTHYNGVALIDMRTHTISFITKASGLSNDYVRSITENAEKKIVIGTFNGLNILDPQTKKIVNYSVADYKDGSLSHYSIYSLFIDNAETLWIGTYGGGISYSNKYGNKFHFYDPSKEQRSLMGIIGPMLEYQNSLFIATEGGGLLELNRKFDHNSYRSYTNSKSTLSRDILKSVYLDGDQILCGNNRGRIYSFDVKNRKFSEFYDFGTENTIYQIGRNLSGELYAVGVNTIGLTFFTKDSKVKNSFKLANDSSFSFHDARCLFEIEKNVYLIGLRNNGLQLYDANKRILKKYKRSRNSVSESGIPENYVTSIIKDSRGYIWIGTYGGGISLFNIEKETFETFNASAGLQSNDVCAIVEDRNGYLWISTISGISRFDVENKEFTNYDHSSGIKVDEFTPHAGIRLSDGQILFSGNNGFTSFNPHEMLTNPYKPTVVFKGISVNNKRIVPFGEDGILKGELKDLNEIKLEYDQTNIAIEYSALNFILPERNQYMYKLEGFDKEWNEAGSRRIAYYTNIPAGTYRLIVKASNNDGLWNDEGTSITIKVLPPFWKTWWAYCFYALLLSIISYLIFRYYNERKQLENAIKIEQAKAEAQQEFHEARNKLFTNFSHELRTPLSLIMSPLKDLVDNGANLPSKVHDSHKLMYNNTQRILRLVNNLMDFQKKESGTMELKLEHHDFVAFSDEMISLFQELAFSRKINLNFKHEIASLDYCFDVSLMEKVFFNFLSNAFKNVPDEGIITIVLDKIPSAKLEQQFPDKAATIGNRVTQYILFEVYDSGKGIPEDDLENIFIPFYQVSQNKHSASGTGLGLSLSKSIIELHNGVVWADNQDTGGAVFRCILPIGKSLNDDLVVDNSDEREQSSLYREVELPSKNIAVPIYSKDKKYTILIVEDNPDVQAYIMTCLSDKYNILLAADGEEGVEKAVLKQPDLIISDLMMPRMDGMKMSSILKNDIRTSHIPIIMLTARAMTADIEEGYTIGADDYITKPFESSLLIVRVDNLIKSREMLKQIYGKDFSLDTLGINVSPLDEQFMDKLYNIMEQNISNSQFNLDIFSSEIGMSKASLYRKIKSITDLSPNEFIRNYRLEIGAKLLRETQLPISEIYVSVGFNSIAYFSTCFKNRYGVSPSEYLVDIKRV